MEVAVGDAPPTAVPLRDADVADAFRLGCVEVVAADEPGFDRRLDESLGERVTVTMVDDLEGPTAIGRAPREVGEEFSPAPAGVPARVPTVVVGAVPADHDLGVDRRRSAEDLSARHVHPALLEALLWLGRVVPVDLAAVELGERSRDAKLALAVLAAGLQQEDAHRRVLAEPASQNTARRTRPNDYVVVHGFFGRRTAPFEAASWAFRRGIYLTKHC
jgi:hypothetical protein